MTYKSIVSVMLVLVVFLTASCGSKKYDKPNILLITVEAMRPDHLGVFGYQRDAAPFISSLAKEGLVFKRVVTPQPLTSGSHAAILTSQHPLTVNVTIEGRVLPDNAQTIAEVLQKNGYYTIGTVAVNKLSKEKNFGQGFDSFSDTWEKNPNDKFKGSERRIAQSVNDSLFQQIAQYQADEQNKKKPLFIWVHYYDQRAPISNWDSITFEKKLPGEMEADKRIKRYDKELRYTDNAIQALYKYLEEKKLHKGLVTCITAGCGEQLGEHGYRNTNFDFYGETSLVPLVFHGYNIPEEKMVDTCVSTMDIAVSLLGMAKLNFDYPNEGIDLLKIVRTEDAKIPERKFLVLGTQQFTRSLQLMSTPYTYILNSDYHYKYWYGSLMPKGTYLAPIDDSKFKLLPEKRIKQNGNVKILPLPPVETKALAYVVLRGDLNPVAKPGVEVIARVELHPSLKANTVSFPLSSGKKASPQTLELIYPVFIGDRPVAHVELDESSGTGLTNIRTAIITADEFAKNAPEITNEQFQKKIENALWQDFSANRKEFPKDELFDLSQNTFMMNNQISNSQHAQMIAEFKNLIFKVFDYYSDKRNLLLKGTLSKQELKGRDDQMLKLMGY